jgi:hypothetical protein
MGDTRIVRTNSVGNSGMVPKSPLTIVREEKSGNISDDSYEDEEVLAVTGGVAGVNQMRRRTATQTLADFLRTTGPQDYGMAAPRPPSRAQTPVKKRRGLFFRRKKKQPIRTASPAPGNIPRLQNSSNTNSNVNTTSNNNTSSTGIPTPSGIPNPSQIARPMSPAHRGSSWRLRRKFVALIPGLPGQPQLRTRPPSALRNRADIPDRPTSSSNDHGQNKQSLETMATTNAAKNALLSIPTNIGIGVNGRSAPTSSSGSPVLAPQSTSSASIPPIAMANMEEPLSPVGKSLTSFQSEFSAALAAFLQRPDGGGMSASSRIAAFQAAYGDIRLEDAYKRKRKVQFSRTDDLIDEAMKIPSKAATEQTDECDSVGDEDDSVNDSNMDDDDDISVTLKTPVPIKANGVGVGINALKASTAALKRQTVGVQADLHGLCAQCERRFLQPHSFRPTTVSAIDTSIKYNDNDSTLYMYDQSDDNSSDIDRSISPPPAYQSSTSTMNEFLGMIRTSRRSVRHVQIQTSASCLKPDMVIAIDAMAPKPPPAAKMDMSTQTIKMSIANNNARSNTLTNSPLMALARRHRRLFSDNISNNGSVSSLLLDNGFDGEDDYDDFNSKVTNSTVDSEGSKLAINVLMSQQTDLRERLEDTEELLRIERRDRERLETAMTQARAKFDGVSAQAYKAIRSLMEERQVLMEEVQRLRRFANELLNTSVMAANSANGITMLHGNKPVQHLQQYHRHRNSSLDSSILVIDGEVGDDDNYVDA